MATRSRIGKKNPDGTVTSIYSHWDGYPDGVGKTLNTSYRKPAKVNKLISEGDVSVLKPTIGRKHRFDSQSKSSTFYKRDRGEASTPANSTNEEDFKQLAKESGAEYAYLFDGKKWKEVLRNAPIPDNKKKKMKRL